jgi:NAD(P)-dependent dehydrogenase (short-subunit alcohol dehydrogenase family)
LAADTLPPKRKARRSPLAPDSLQDREIVLAGGTGGVGAASTELLAAEGARLVIGYRARKDRAETFQRFGRIVQADITQAADRRRLLDEAPELYGLVVFAGDPARAKSAEDLEPAMRRSMEVNYTGPILLAREAAEQMRSRGVGGSIVLISTMQAVALFPGSTAYAGAKIALLHAARILAKECRGAGGIRVNVISPGVIAVGMAEASIASGKYDRYRNEGIVQRFGSPLDVARAVRFFLEPDNYITGQSLSVDGGLTL